MPQRGIGDMKKDGLIVLILAGLLSGCGGHIHSEKWYLAHTKATDAINKKCNDSESYVRDHHHLCRVIGHVIGERWIIDTDKAIDSGHPYNN